MSTAFKHIAITSRADFTDKENVLKNIVEIAEKAGAKVCVDENTCDVPALASCDRFSELKGFDLLIVVGGDGTIIATVRELKDLSIPILGIHHGTLGFLTELEADETEALLPDLLQGKGFIDERQLLSVCIEENGQQKCIGRVLNEAVISQSGISRLINLRTEIAGEELTTFRADGLILATPTGSTAYSLAAGGAIVHPRVTQHEILLTPINPHSFFQKPIIIPGDQDIAVEVITPDNTYRAIDATLTLDGQISLPLKRFQKVHVQAHKEHLRFLRRDEDTFYTKIREKLRWGEAYEDDGINR